MSKSSQSNFYHVASAPSSLETMMSDEDGTSRDSGICEMMDENTPVNFASFSRKYSEEAMEVDEFPENSRPGTISLRREKSTCQVRLFDTSPITPVAPRPTLLVLRDLNQQGTSNGLQDSDSGCLKRLLVTYDSEFEGIRKMSKKDQSLHYKTENADGGDDDEELMSKEMDLDEIFEGVRRQESRGVEMEETESGTSTSLAVRKVEGQDSTVFARPTGKRYKNAGTSAHRLKTAKLTPMVMEMERDDDIEVMETVNEEELAVEEDDQPFDDGFHLFVNYSLPPVKLGSSSCFRRINASTLIKIIMDHPGEEFLKKYILIDCRYPYEYEGGHVKHAINVYNPLKVQSLFYKDKQCLHKRIPIFYCEYSQKRGPSMANTLRKIDRLNNTNNYPNVFFPEMYVLDKGYKGFYLKTRHRPTQELCTPNSYVEMLHPNYTDTLRMFSLHKKTSSTGQSMFRAFKSAPGDFDIAFSIEDMETVELFKEGSSNNAVLAKTEKNENRPISPDENKSENVAIQTTPAPRNNAFKKFNSRRTLFVSESPTQFGRAGISQQSDENSPPTPRNLNLDFTSP